MPKAFKSDAYMAQWTPKVQCYIFSVFLFATKTKLSSEHMRFRNQSTPIGEAHRDGKKQAIKNGLTDISRAEKSCKRLFSM